LANHLYNEYDLLGISAYNFIFRNMTRSKTMKECISSGHLYLIRHLKKYYGMYYQRIDKQSPEKTAELVYKRSVNNKPPVMFCIDTFYIPWSRYYQSLHYEHFIIVYGVEKDKFLCVDPTEKNPYQILPFYSKLFLHISHIIIVYARQQPIQYQMAKNDSLQYIHVDRMQTALHLFSRTFFSIDDIEKHINLKDNDLWLCPVSLTMFYKLPGLRHMYANYLNILHEKELIGPVDQIIKRLKETASLWLSFYKNFMKLYYSGCYASDKQFLKPILAQIIDLEKQTGRSIQKIFQQGA